MIPRTLRLSAVLFLLGLSAGACKKVIGDSCSASTDCSANGDRQCDVSEANGYCTIQGCDPNGCPDDALCVGFDAHAPRLERRFCMAGCAVDDDCRTPEYRCVRPDPRACVNTANATGILPDGRSCNVLIDTVSRAAGYCAPAVP
jgi:hypothetical protein